MVTDEMHAHIIRGLQAIGSSGQRMLRSFSNAGNQPMKVDFTENSEPYDVRYFSQSMKECLVCCETFKAGCEVVRMPCNLDLHFFHKTCIERWLVNNQNCPLCRRTVARIELESDANDPRSAQERENDEAFERLLVGPMGVPRQGSVNSRRVSLLSSDLMSNAASDHNLSINN